jgi:predicted GNAT family N-acyltransferase
MNRTDAIVVCKATTQAQRDVCFAIRRQVFVEEQKVPPELEYDEHDATALHFLALHQDEPVGVARIVFKDDRPIAKIGRVAVLKKARRLGAGSAIMRALEADPDVRQVKQFVLEAQTYAIPFYENLGYRAEGDVYEDCGIPHRWMHKETDQIMTATAVGAA